MAINALLLSFLNPSLEIPKTPPATVVVEQIAQWTPNGKVRVWDATGKLIPSAQSPFHHQPSDRNPPSGHSAYAIVLRLKSEAEMPVFDRTYVEDAQHKRVDVPELSCTGQSNVFLESLYFNLRSDQRSTVVHCKVADGPFEKYLDEVVDNAHHGGLKLVKRASGGSSEGPVSVFEYALPRSDLGQWDDRGAATASDGRTARAFMPLPRMDLRTGQVVGEYLWFTCGKGANIVHLSLKRRPFQTLKIGPIPLEPK